MRLAAVIAALAAALVVVANAPAAILVAFGPSDAAVGARVQVFTADGGGNAASVGGSLDYEVYLVPVALASSVGKRRVLHEPGVAYIGGLRYDARNVARTSFEVPDVPPGPYAGVAYCTSCGSFVPYKPSPGNVGVLEVTGAGAGGDRSLAAIGVGGTLVLLLVGTGLARRRRR